MTPARPTPDSIESDIEAARLRLAGTIDELTYRVSPKTIVKREVAGIKGFFVDEQGTPRTDNILKLAGGFAGFVAVVIVIRKVAG